MLEVNQEIPSGYSKYLLEREGSESEVVVACVLEAGCFAPGGRLLLSHHKMKQLKVKLRKLD